MKGRHFEAVMADQAKPPAADVVETVAVLEEKVRNLASLLDDAEAAIAGQNKRLAQIDAIHFSIARLLSG